jgi:peroxiredoxin
MDGEDRPEPSESRFVCKGEKNQEAAGAPRSSASYMKSKIVLFAVGSLLAVLALVFFTTFSERNAPVDSAGKGVTAPLFSLTTPSGEKIHLADFRGKVIILDFWATWCPPCKEGIPHLNQLYREYRKDGLVVIGISLDRGGPEEVRRFLDQKGVEYITVMGNEEVFQAYSGLPGLGKIQGIPTAFIVDREGRVHQKFVGLTPKQTLEAAIKPIL